MREINRIIIHCSDTDYGNVESIRRFHMDIRGWRDIGYHFVILNGKPSQLERFHPDADGAVFTGRPIHSPGAHTIGHNQDSIGICLIGKTCFTPMQLLFGLPTLLRELMLKYEITPDRVFGHHDFSCKPCPNIETKLLRWIASAAILEQKGP